MEVLREIASLCDQLPIIDNQLFKKDFYSVSGYEIELIYPLFDDYWMHSHSKLMKFCSCLIWLLSPRA